MNKMAAIRQPREKQPNHKCIATYTSDIGKRTKVWLLRKPSRYLVKHYRLQVDNKWKHIQRLDTTFTDQDNAKSYGLTWIEPTS